MTRSSSAGHAPEMVEHGNESASNALQLTTVRCPDVESRATNGEISATVEMPSANARRRCSCACAIRRPAHALGLGQWKEWSDFDPAKEWVRVANPGEKIYTVVARY